MTSKKKVSGWLNPLMLKKESDRVDGLPLASPEKAQYRVSVSQTR